MNPLRDFHGLSKQVDVSCGWLTKPSAASTKVPARRYLFSGKQVWVWCFGMHQRHWSCCFTVPVEVLMQSPLAGVRFLIYFAFLAAAVQKCEAVCAPAALSDLRAGLWHINIIFCCLQALDSFLHVSFLENSCVLAAQLWGIVHAAFMKPCVRWHAPIITVIQY